MRPSVLFVEDEEALRMTVGDRLRSDGYIVACAADGDEGFEKATQLPFDLIILDLMLPHRDGLSICRDLRKAGVITPLLMLTAKGQTQDKILGLKTGADDYVTKPFHMQELLARIEALLRRVPTGLTGGRGVYQFAAIRVDARATEVTRDGKPVSLSVREFQLLKYLIENAGVTVSREQLLVDVWGYNGKIFTRTVDVHIASLRQKLEHDPKRPLFIQTVQRVGYRFTPEAGTPLRITLGERTLAMVLVVPTALAVIMLAIVQYRWSEEVRTATSIRLADSLQMSMMSWHLNLFRDLSDVCLGMRLDSRHVGGQELEQTVRRFQELQAAADYREVVSEVNLVSSDPRLPNLRWNPAAQRFAPVQASRLEALQAQLSRSPTTATPGAAGTPRSGGAYGSAYTPADSRDWQFAPDFPALLRPISTDAVVFDRQSKSGRVAAWLMIQLDVDVLGRRVLPDLANRYFSGVDGLDYQVALVAGTRPRRVIYSSDPSFAIEDPLDADGRMNLFGRRLDQAVASPLYVFHQPSRSVAPPVAVSMAWFPLLGEHPVQDDWQLVVRHRRGGALGTFVEDIHRRDLSISFGLLLLLVISMTMWIILGHRAQRLAKLQMNFVTAVSHDLRTPITIISSAADNIARGVVHERQQVAQYGTVIGSQARRLSAFVEQVLLFASIRDSSHRYVLRPIDVADAIETTLAASAELIQASRVSVEREIERNLPPVMGDSFGLSQCLQNLITNALKYGGEPAWLGVRAVLAKNGAGTEIQVSISDKGIGIPPSDLRHIFRPFYRSPSVTATQIHGTGLGLAVANSVAEAMNGHLTVVSVRGEGSTFTLHLPCAKETARSPVS